MTSPIYEGASEEQRRRMRADLFPAPARHEKVTTLPASVLADPPLEAVLHAIQSAKGTLQSAAALVQCDVRLGGRSAFLCVNDLRRGLHHLLAFAAADVALLFDTQGADVLGFFEARASSLVAVRDFKGSLEAEWARLKAPMLSVRNNLTHHAPFSHKGHNHGMVSLEQIRFTDLARLVSLCECCIESLLSPVGDARVAAMRAFMAGLDHPSHELNWQLSYPHVYPYTPSLIGLTRNAIRWPAARLQVAFRDWAERRERKQARERVDWHTAPDTGAMLLATYAVNGSAALSQLYFGMLAGDVYCGPRSVIKGPFERAMIRQRILRVFYASVFRLFEPGRVNLIVAAERNWPVLPKTARSLFASFLWPLWRAYKDELRWFRNAGAYHFSRSVDDHSSAFVRFQKRVHPNSVQSLLYMSFAFLEHANARDIGLPFVQPHPSIAPAKAFDPRHFAPVYGTILGQNFFTTPDFQLILQHQPRNDCEEFPVPA